MEEAAQQKFGRVLKSTPEASSWVCLDFGCAALGCPTLPRRRHPQQRLFHGARRSARRPRLAPRDVVAHVFTPAERDNYDLVGLYAKATEARLPQHSSGQGFRARRAEARRPACLRPRHRNSDRARPSPPQVALPFEVVQSK